jgi:hypothetical protein
MKPIITWVNKREQNHIEKINSRYNLNFIFVNNFDDFMNGIQSDTIPLILRRKANVYYNKLVKLLATYQKRIFYAYVPNNSYEVFVKESLFSEEKNVVSLDETELFRLLSVKSM